MRTRDVILIVCAAGMVAWTTPARAEKPPKAATASTKPAAEKTAPAASHVPEAEWNADDPVDMGGGGFTESEGRIREALNATTRCDFVNVPLREAINRLKRQHNIEIALDRGSLAEQGIGPDTPVTLRVNGVTLRSALSRLLGDRELTYTVKDETLLILTRTAAELPQNLRTAIYPVADLIVPPGGDIAEADFTGLIRVIAESVQRWSWSDNGGEATIKELFNTHLLVVTHNEEAHHQIEQLLAELRKHGRKPAGTAQATAAGSGRNAETAARPSVAANDGVEAGRAVRKAGRFRWDRAGRAAR